MRLLTPLVIGTLAAAPLLAQNRICTLDGAKDLDAHGRAVSSAGDVDRDGYPDFIVGAVLGSFLPGSAVVYSGRDSRQLYKYDGLGGADTLGSAVAAAGDVDRDGYDDFLIGAPQDCG